MKCYYIGKNDKKSFAESKLSILFYTREDSVYEAHLYRAHQRGNGTGTDSERTL